MNKEIFDRLKAIMDDFGPIASWCADLQGCEICPWNYGTTNDTDCVLDNIGDWVKEHE